MFSSEGAYLPHTRLTMPSPSVARPSPRPPPPPPPQELVRLVEDAEFRLERLHTSELDWAKMELYFGGRT